jgi:hypothetical protein
MLQQRKKNVSRTDVSLNANSHGSELRTSGRSVRKISYAESEESEDAGEEKLNKSQKVMICAHDLNFFLDKFVEENLK